MEDLCNADKHTLRQVWNGIEGERMYRRLRGEQVYLPPTKKSSIGHSHVLSPENRSPDAAFAVLHKLLQKAATRLRNDKLLSGRLQIKLDYLGQGYNDHSWRDKMKLDPIDDTLELLQAMKRMWQRRPAGKPPFLRVSVVLTDLVQKQAHSLSLFEEPRIREQLNSAIDTINHRFGRNSVYFAGAHRAMDSAPMRIAFTHIPDPDVEGDG